MAGDSQVPVRAVTWNIFHGRDDPPDSSAAHTHVNRPLSDEFARMLAGWSWDVALLQEAPPRWLGALASGAGASGAASALTARNWAAPVRGWLADWNPDLMGPHEGGSNQLVVRPPWRIAETRRLTLTWRPERRRMIWARLTGPGGARLAVANMHLTARDSPKAGREALLAAEHAVEWAGADPLILGGDLNAADAFTEMHERFGFGPEPSDDSPTIEHLMSRRLEVVERPRELPAEARDLGAPEGKLLRLSDHPPLVADFSLRADG